jgi:cell division protein FtsN
VGSFRAQEHAERLSKSLLQKGYHAYVSVFAKPGDGSWYRVRVGGFSDRTMANQTAQRLRAQEQLSAVVATD